ncbi:MAG: methyltransferase domain-containing protein [Chloroflexi bacterium]|nr:methyltransferase domain-containing protein [Chloroflexota bacterium]
MKNKIPILLILILVLTIPLFAEDPGPDRHYLHHIISENGYNKPIREKMALEYIGIFGLKSGESIGDVGCATGDFCWYFLDKVGKSGKVYGIDKNEVSINYLKKRVDKKKVDNLIPVVSKEIGFPLPDKTLDAVLLSEVHMLGQKDKLHQIDIEKPFLKEIYRVMKPGGRFLVVDGAFVNPLSTPVNYGDIVIKLCRQAGFKAVTKEVRRCRNCESAYLLFVREK